MDALLDPHRFELPGASLQLHAPVTIDAEVLHSVRRQWMIRRIDDARAQEIFEFFQSLPITRHPVQPLVPRMWEMRRNVTAYDAGYVALAESLNLPVLTRDRRLSRSSGHAARIEYID